jgi:hypothetical protein
VITNRSELNNGQAVIAEWKWSGDGVKAGQWLSRG